MLGKQNIFLIGPMGAGKTAVGRHVARLLDYPFYDADQEIEQRTGADVPLIFEREGEAGFRRREREVKADLVRYERIVLATGGGAILDENTRRDLAEHGWVVYLEASVAQQAERAARTRPRPLLHDTDPLLRLEQLLRVRTPLYRPTADLTISTNHRRVAAVAQRVVQAYSEASRADPQADAEAARERSPPV